jgi:hypothetical protein
LKKILFVLLIVMFMVPATVMAATVKIYGGSYQSGRGGEFTVQGLDGAGSADVMHWAAGYSAATKNQSNPPSIQTFCLEYGETFSYGTIYNYSLNTAALNGGVGPAGDEISIGTAWLYNAFSKGTLEGYFTGGDRTTQAGLLQNAIWYLEGEIGDQALNPYFTMLAGEGITDPFANANGAYGVRALNLTDSSGNRAQDQLVKVNTPVPPTIWLLGSGLVGLVGLRRRFKR